MALPQERFEEIKKSLQQKQDGLSTGDFAQIKADLSRKKRETQEKRSAEETGAFFPAVTGESPFTASFKSVGNVPSSAINLVKNLGTAILNPIETAKGLGQVVAGGARTAGEALGVLKEKETPSEATFDAVVEGLKERFGSLEALQRTATNDPFGFATDILAIIAPTGVLKTLTKTRLAPEPVRTKVAGALEKSAEKSITEALAPTKEVTKIQTQKIVPELRKRKIIAFSQEGLSQQIKKNLQESGQRFDEAISKIPPETQVKIKPIIDALENTKSQFLIKGTDKIAEPQAFKAANDLQEIVASLGNTASFESLRSLRQIWDSTVAKSKGFQKQLADIDKLDIKKDGTNAIRRELAKDFPSLDKVNAEFSLWKNADDVISETLKRTTGQRVPLGQRFAQVGGGAVGFTKFGITEGIIFAVAAKNAIKLFSSTAWKTISATQKQKLAEFLTNGKVADFNKLIRNLLIAQGLEPLNEEEKE